MPVSPEVQKEEWRKVVYKQSKGLEARWAEEHRSSCDARLGEAATAGSQASPQIWSLTSPVRVVGSLQSSRNARETNCSMLTIV